MTRGEFRRALDRAHAGIIETGDGARHSLADLLDQIARKAPERDPKLDAAARRAYIIQAKYESGALSHEQEMAFDMVESGELSEADALAVMTGTKTITGDILTPTPRDTRPKKTTRKRS